MCSQLPTFLKPGTKRVRPIGNISELPGIVATIAEHSTGSSDPDLFVSAEIASLPSVATKQTSPAAVRRIRNRIAIQRPENTSKSRRAHIRNRALTRKLRLIGSG
jgi:hypothetical protein